MSFNSAFSYVLYRFVLPHSWGREPRVVEISLLPNRRWAGGSREGMNWRCQCISICYVYDMVWVRWDNYIYTIYLLFHKYIYICTYYELYTYALDLCFPVLLQHSSGGSSLIPETEVNACRKQEIGVATLAVNLEVAVPANCTQGPYNALETNQILLTQVRMIISLYHIQYMYTSK